MTSLDEVLEEFVWDLATPEINTEKLFNGLCVQSRIAEPIVVSFGGGGALIGDEPTRVWVSPVFSLENQRSPPAGMS